MLCIQNKVHAACNQLCHRQWCAADKTAEVVPMQQILADLQFFTELRVSDLGNIHIAIAGLITLCVLFHGRFQRRSNAHIVNDQTALFVLENAVYAGNSLHQIVAVHGLVHIHGG